MNSISDSPAARLALLAILLAVWCGDGVTAEPVRYNRDVLPILAENCFACHGFDPAARQAGLRLDTASGATQSAIVPGDPRASELVARIDSGDPDDVMPPADSGKHLTVSQRDVLRRWIAEGAEYEVHWAFLSPSQSQPPQIGDVDHPIDRFVQARLAKQQMAPSPLADHATLIRRVSLDLIGLPPTLEEIDAFEQAAAANPESAWRDLVDRLLASPHYGERWGRWWLDQARYADSNGYSIDAPRSIWKYRDWVVAALNDDMPFDQFTIQQLAGDLLERATNSQQVATGFHRNTQINQEGGIDREQYRIDSIFDRVATTGTVWLGLTIGCAQCHDHKFDPIEQKEFYRLFAFLNNQDEPTIKVYDPEIDVTAVTARRKEAETTLKAILERHAEKIGVWESGLDDESRKALAADVRKILDVDATKRSFAQKLALLAAVGTEDPDFDAARETYRESGEMLDDAPTTMVLRERSKPRTTNVLVKGDFTRKADEVSPGTPAVLHPMESSSENLNRLDLAQWIVDPKNPLTARVIVNRIWQQYFGRGLVATENDFGLLGERPTHPQMLDWLAVEFMQRDWSMKEIHRLIVTSHTYRQSSRRASDATLADPDNRLLSRQQRLRLDAEIVRDVALRASGLLATKLGGPPVFPPIPSGVMSQGQVKRAWNESRGEDRYRRGIYTFLYRATPPPSLNVFDAPDGFSSCTRRNRSNTPLQSLTLMNDAAFIECAEALTKVIDGDGLHVAFRRCTGRHPDEKELAVLQRLDSQTAARVLLNLDETITRE